METKLHGYTFVFAKLSLRINQQLEQPFLVGNLILFMMLSAAHQYRTRPDTNGTNREQGRMRTAPIEGRIRMDYILA